MWFVQGSLTPMRSVLLTPGSETASPQLSAGYDEWSFAKHLKQTSLRCE